MTRCHVAVTLAVLLAATPARADDPEAARVHFEQATALYNSGDFALSLAEFQAAYDAKPHPTVLRNIAAVYEAMRRYADAIATLERYLRESQGRRELRAERAAVDAHLVALRNLVGRLVIVAPEGASLEVDGEAVGTAPLAGPLVVANGSHSVQATLPGHDPDLQRIDVRNTGEARVELRPVARMARLTIDTSAPHATVSIDGGPAAPAPRSVSLMPGRHLVRTTAPGRRASEVTVDLGPGAERSLVLQLETGGPQGMMAIEVTPAAGARVLVDGRPLGPNARDALTLEQGLHQVVVTGDRRVTFEEGVTVRANRTTRVNVRLVEKRLYVAPIWGTVAAIGTAAFLASGIYFGLAAIDATNDYQDPDTPTDDLQGLYDQRADHAQTSTASFVAAALSGTATLLLYYWSRGGRPRSEAQIDFTAIE